MGPAVSATTRRRAGASRSQAVLNPLRTTTTGQDGATTARNVDLAERVGCTTRTVAAALAQLRQEGAIQVSYTDRRQRVITLT